MAHRTESSNGSRTAVLVLGMHRSGTSALARVLNLLGVDLGSSLMGASFDNRSGFWEHQEIVLLHERLLAELGTTWDDLMPLSTEMLNSQAVRPYRQQLLDILRRDFSSSTCWGVKDPRLCRLLPLWSSVLEEIGVSPRFVLMCRDPREVAASLRERNGFPNEKSHLLWLDHSLAAEHGTRGKIRAFLTYDQLLGDARRVVDRLLRELRVADLRETAQARKEMGTFLDPNLRHHQVRVTAAETDLHRWLQVTYEAFQQAATNSSPEIERLLDVIAERTSTARQLYAPWLRQLQKHSSHTAELVRERNLTIARLHGQIEKLSGGSVPAIAPPAASSTAPVSPVAETPSDPFTDVSPVVEALTQASSGPAQEDAPAESDTPGDEVPPSSSAWDTPSTENSTPETPSPTEAPPSTEAPVRAQPGSRNTPASSSSITRTYEDPEGSPEVSIIIPLFNKVALTEQCVISLAEHTTPGTYEVILVDNGSTDETKALLDSLEGNVKIVSNEKNLGFANACNQGAEIASTDRLLFLSSGIRPREGWLEPLMETLEGDPAVAAVGAKLVLPDGTIQHAGVALLSDASSANPLGAFDLYYGEPGNSEPANAPSEVPALSGACLLVRKSNFEEVKGFDALYWNGCEDIDLCLKLREKGWKVVYQPRTELTHRESEGGVDAYLSGRANEKLLCTRWFGKFEADVIVEKDGARYPTESGGIRPYTPPARNGEVDGRIEDRPGSERREVEMAEPEVEPTAGPESPIEPAPAPPSPAARPAIAPATGWAGVVPGPEITEDEVPADEAPIDEAPTDEAPTEEAPTEEAPTEEAAIEEPLSGEASTEETAIDDAGNDGLLDLEAPATPELEPEPAETADLAGESGGESDVADEIAESPEVSELPEESVPLVASSPHAFAAVAGAAPRVIDEPVPAEESEEMPAVATAAPLVSIIVVIRNQLTHTRVCVESLRKYTPESHEIIFVDNGSSDGTLEYLRNAVRGIDHASVISVGKNLGFAGGNNQGMALARGKYVLLLNNDTVVTEGWLEGMLDVLEEFPEAGLVGPRTNYSSGPQLVTEATYTSLAEMEGFAETWSLDRAGRSEPARRLVGFCLLMRREVIDSIGGLDQRFGDGNCEDDDYCLRAFQAGFRARIAEDVFIHHTGGRTFEGEGIDYRENMVRNFELFKQKWGLGAECGLEDGYPFMELVSHPPHPRIPLPDLSSQYLPEMEGRWLQNKAIAPTTAKQSDYRLRVGVLPGEVVSPALQELFQRYGHRDGIPTWHTTAELQQQMRDPGLVLLLGPDVILTDDALKELVAIAVADKTIAAVGPKSNAAPAPQRLRGDYKNLKRGLHRYVARRRRQHRSSWEEVPYLGGFCLLMRAEALDKVDGLREDLPIENALLELFGRLRQGGLHIACAQGAYVHHGVLSEHEGALYDESASTVVEVDTPHDSPEDPLTE